jgi:branched-chain amino acid transport system substrate-binding protein
MDRPVENTHHPLMRFLFSVLTIVAGPCLITSTGCRSKTANTNEIVVGHYASMTGSEATFGQSTDNGIRLAVDEINEAGGVNGKTIRVITYDDKGDAREAGTAVTRLVARDHVVAVLGEVASSLSLVGAPVCQENGVPMPAIRISPRS